MVTTKTAKLGLRVVMYYGNPAYALKDTVLSKGGEQTYAPQREAFIAKCETFASERNLVWLALNEMCDREVQGKRGSARTKRMAGTTLGMVDLVLFRWPIKDTVMLPHELVSFLASKPNAIVAPTGKSKGKSKIKVSELDRRDKAKRIFYANIIKEDHCLSILEQSAATGCTLDPQYDGLLVGMNPDIAKGFAKQWDTTRERWKQT